MKHNHIFTNGSVVMEVEVFKQNGTTYGVLGKIIPKKYYPQLLLNLVGEKTVTNLSRVRGSLVAMGEIKVYEVKNV